MKTKLGAGSFGEIFRAIDTWRNKEVAVKLELLKTRHPQLSYESKIYKLLHQGNYEALGIPEIHWSGQEGDFHGMVMDMLGPCLEDLFCYCLRRFSLKTILMLADQMIHRMEFLHTKQFIHRDIKPENFVLGTGARGHVLYVLDFGLSKKFWDPKTRTHIPFKDGKALTGTARYCSINAHKGYEVSRRDDLESIGYLLLYFYKGWLPWQGLNAPDPHIKTVKIGEKKAQTPLEELCRDCPVQFLKYMKYVRGLKFDDTPDYEACRGFFKEVMEEHNFTYDWVFDWITKRETETRAMDADSSGYPPSDNPAFDEESRKSVNSGILQNGNNNAVEASSPKGTSPGTAGAGATPAKAQPTAKTTSSGDPPPATAAQGQQDLPIPQVDVTPS